MSGDERRPVSSGSGAPPPRRSGSATEPTPPPPARRPDREPEPVVVQPAPAVDAAAGRAARKPPQPAQAERADSRRPKERTQVPLLLRLLAWIVAIPLGLVLVGIPARKAGYLSSQKLLDIVIERNLDRYVPLVVIVVLWALVTAVLVQVFVEGGGWLMRRRQARRA